MKGNVNSRWGRRPASGRRGRHAAKSRLSRLLALFSAVSLAGGLMFALAAPASAAVGEPGSSTNPYVQHQGIPICHRTNSDTNPYVSESPDFDSIVKNSGHDSHEGPVWDASLKASHTKWGDIIPPFWYTKNGSPATQYLGQNWDASGQEILNNGCGIPVASLSLVKTADLSSFSIASDKIAYTFVVTNTGETTVSDLKIDDFFFSGRGTLSDIDCADLTLAPRESTQCSATYQIEDGDVTAKASIRNTARAIGTSFGRMVKSNESSAVVPFKRGEEVEPPTPGYELWKTSEANWTASPMTITYTLHLQRINAEPVTNAGATDELPPGVTLISPPTTVSGAGTIVNDNGTIRWTNVPLNSSAEVTATFTVSVTAEPGTPIVNHALPSGTDRGECRSSKDEVDLCTTTDTVPPAIPDPSWSIKKSASPTGEVTPGSTISYTLTATNRGETDVYGAQAVDKLPIGVTVDEDSLPFGLAYDPGSHSLTWTFDLEAGPGNDTATVKYVVTVTAGAGATLVNAITEVSAGGQCEPVEDVSEFRNVVSAFTSIDTESDANANCVTTNRTPADSSTSTPPADTDTDTPADTGTPEVQGVSRVEPEAAKPPIVVKGVSQELPPAPVIKVKPAAQVAPAPSANAHTGQGQSPWAYLLFGAGALLLLGAWRVRRNGNA